MNVSSFIPLEVGQGIYALGKNCHFNFKQNSEQRNYISNMNKILPQIGQWSLIPQFSYNPLERNNNNIHKILLRPGF